MADENGLSTDDPTENMPDAPEVESDGGDDEDGGLRALLQQHGKGDAEDEDAPEEEADAEPETPAAEVKADEQPDPAEEKRFSQRDLERHIGERLARDRNVKAIRELEAVTGLPLDKLLTQARQNRIQTMQDEYGMDEQTAATIVAQQEENQQLKADQEALQVERQQLAYDREKAQHLSNPLVKQYEAEIDAFTGKGTAGVTFEVGAAYVLGQKVQSGELLKSVQQAAEQKTLAQVQKRGRVAPVSAGAGGAQTEALNATERALARKLGVDPKDWAAEKNRIAKSR